MKLKLVAAMSALGLISCSFAYADDAAQTTTNTTTQTQTAAPVKHHRHHHKMKHHMVAAHPSFKGDYKGEVVPAPVVEACPINNWYTSMMDAMNQNLGRAKPTVDCYKPISFAAGIATDVHFGNLSQGYMGENNERISLNDAYLNIFGNVNQYVKAFASLSYNNASGQNQIEGSNHGVIVNGSSQGVRAYNGDLANNGQYDAAVSPNTLTVEQAYITFSDFDNMPVFFQIGKQYADYGRYTIHPIERTMTQVLTETLRTSAEVGFVTRAYGIHGSVSAFDSPSRKLSEQHSHYVYTAALGIDQPSESLGWDLGVGYMSDLNGANDIGSTVGSVYVHRVGAANVFADLNYGPFAFGARYATALQSYNGTDLAQNATSGSGAKPWAVDLKAGYGFNAWCKNQNVYLGYQKSGQAAQIPLPSSRWLLGYGIDILQNTMLGAEIGHDVAYSTSKTGFDNSENSNTIGLRAAVKFG